MSTMSYEIEKQQPSDMNDITTDALAANRRFYQRYPNRWCYIRERYLREAASEFFGTMILLMCVAFDATRSFFC